MQNKTKSPPNSCICLFFPMATPASHFHLLKPPFRFSLPPFSSSLLVQHIQDLSKYSPTEAPKFLNVNKVKAMRSPTQLFCLFYALPKPFCSSITRALPNQLNYNYPTQQGIFQLLAHAHFFPSLPCQHQAGTGDSKS